MTARPSFRRRNLVYTSAGPRHQVRRWLQDRRSFDVWVTAYDPAARGIAPLVERYVERAGSKFENLHALWAEDPSAFDTYENVLVLDDDILISARRLERLFRLHDEHGLLVSQPGLLPSGMVTHPVTRQRPTCLLRHTDFVEVNMVLARRHQLVSFLQEFRGVLPDWGVDYWLIHHLGDQASGRVAVIDDVPAINPRKTVKGVGDIDAYGAREDRVRAWKALAAERGIPEFAPSTVDRVLNRPHRMVVNVARYAASQAHRAVRGLWQRLRRA